MKKLLTIIAVIAIVCSPSFAEEPKTVEDVYPGLALNILTKAKLAPMPEPVILRINGADRITTNDLTQLIEGMNPTLKKQHEEDLFFTLEFCSGASILAEEALATYAKDGTSTKQKHPTFVANEFANYLVKKMNLAVTDEEVEETIKKYPEQAKDMTKEEVKKKLLAIKTANAVSQVWKDTGKRLNIEVSEQWVKKQAANIKESPIDKALKSGKPVAVVLLSGMTKLAQERAANQPVVEKVFKEYSGKFETLVLEQGEHMVLCRRRGIGIGQPAVFLFYHKNGKEAGRFNGWLPEKGIKETLENILKAD